MITLCNRDFAAEVHSTIRFYSGICMLIPNQKSNLLHHVTIILNLQGCKITKNKIIYQISVFSLSLPVACRPGKSLFFPYRSSTSQERRLPNWRSRPAVNPLSQTLEGTMPNMNVTINNLCVFSNHSVFMTQKNWYYLHRAHSCFFFFMRHNYSGSKIRTSC